MQVIDEKKEVKKFIITLLMLAVIFVVFQKVFSVNMVSGNSMSDTVCDGGIVLVNKINYQVNRYDIVLAKTKMYNSNIEQISIKRVIAMPYDAVKICDGIIFVNGSPTEKYNYYTGDGGGFCEEIILGKDEYFLVGDNRRESYDSRFYGAVNINKIIGEVNYILYKGGR